MALSMLNETKINEEILKSELPESLVLWKNKIKVDQRMKSLLPASLVIEAHREVTPEYIT